MRIPWLILFLFVIQSSLHAQQTSEQFLREGLQSLEQGRNKTIKGTLLYQPDAVIRFYKLRSDKPAWIHAQGSAWSSLLEAIASTEEHGLQADDYHFQVLQSLLNPSTFHAYSPSDSAALDIILSDAFLLIGTHLYQGKVRPSSVDRDWKIKSGREDASIEELVHQYLQQAGSIQGMLASFAPESPRYAGLINGLKTYQSLARIPDKSPIQIKNLPLRPDSNHVVIPEIRTRLSLLGYLQPYEVKSMNVYDSVLQLAVKEFQRLHGLNADGLIGKNTLDQLNIPIGARIDRIKANLERMRWLPDLQAEKAVWVNAADQRMFLLSDRDTLFQARAIVGRVSRKTPSFQAAMNHLVFSPTWTVPPTILYNDVIPAVRKDITYLAGKNMQVLSMSGEVVDPSSIDWKNIRRNFPYMIRQGPGPDNALGLVKFMFPNPYNVYLHDTPAKSLFAKDERTLSSGCIRIENPEQLAFLLLESQGWDKERIKTAMLGKREQTVRLEKPIPTTISYLTAWADGAGSLHFRADVYSKDPPLIKALQKKVEAGK